MALDNTKQFVLFPNGQIMGGLMYIETGPDTYEPWDGTVDISFGATSIAINDGVDNGIKATVIESTEEIGVFGLVILNPDGSNIGGGSSGGAVTIADGADVAEGATTDAAVTGDNTGTLSAKLRGINKILANVWDSVNSRLNVFIQNATLAVTQSGSWVLSAGSAIIGAVTGSVADDSPTPGNPITVGGLAKSPDGTSPGNVSAEDDVARVITDLNRIIYVNTADPTTRHFNFCGNVAADQEEIAAAPGAGFQAVITRVRFSNGAAVTQELWFESNDVLLAGAYYIKPEYGVGFMFDCHIPAPANQNITVSSVDDGQQTIEVEWIVKKV